VCLARVERAIGRAEGICREEENMPETEVSMDDDNNVYEEGLLDEEDKLNEGDEFDDVDDNGLPHEDRAPNGCDL
jgi:hypothetical protein